MKARFRGDGIVMREHPYQASATGGWVLKRAIADLALSFVVACPASPSGR
jgi:heterodisulfide reductase subunit A-like polyferredoxin